MLTKRYGSLDQSRRIHAVDLAQGPGHVPALRRPAVQDLDLVLEVLPEVVVDPVLRVPAPVHQPDQTVRGQDPDRRSRQDPQRLPILGVPKADLFRALEAVQVLVHRPDRNGLATPVHHPAAAQTRIVLCYWTEIVDCNL